MRTATNPVETNHLWLGKQFVRRLMMFGEYSSDLSSVPGAPQRPSQQRAASAAPRTPERQRSPSADYFKTPRAFCSGSTAPPLREGQRQSRARSRNFRSFTKEEGTA